MTEVQQAPAGPPSAPLPGRCPKHPQKRLRQVIGHGPPSCEVCDQMKAWELRKIQHAKQQHQKYASCMTCAQLEIERKKLERIAQGLSPFLEPPSWVPMPLTLASIDDGRPIPVPAVKPVDTQPPQQATARAETKAEPKKQTGGIVINNAADLNKVVAGKEGKAK